MVFKKFMCKLNSIVEDDKWSLERIAYMILFISLYAPLFYGICKLDYAKVSLAGLYLTTYSNFLFTVIFSVIGVILLIISLIIKIRNKSNSLKDFEWVSEQMFIITVSICTIYSIISCFVMGEDVALAVHLTYCAIFLGLVYCVFVVSVFLIDYLLKKKRGF